MKQKSGCVESKNNYQNITLFVILNAMKNPDPPDKRCFTPFNMTK